MMGPQAQKRCHNHGVLALSAATTFSHILRVRNATCCSDTALLCFSVSFTDLVLVFTPHLRNATVHEIFCVYGAEPLRVCQATWNPATPPSWSHPHNGMWGSGSLCSSSHVNRPSSPALRTLHWCRFLKAAATRSCTPCVDFLESNHPLLLGAGSPKAVMS